MFLVDKAGEAADCLSQAHPFIQAKVKAAHTMEKEKQPNLDKHTCQTHSNNVSRPLS